MLRAIAVGSAKKVQVPKSLEGFWVLGFGVGVGD